jgi:trehalose-6-phosphatase
MSTSIPRLSISKLEEAFKMTGKRLLLLDDDGTLRFPTGSAMEGFEDSKMIEVLKKLCSDYQNSVYLMSSRTKAQLEHLIELIPSLGLS